MPYIKQIDRQRLAFRDTLHPENAGELNYCITSLIAQYLKDKGATSYQSINDILGALDGATQEFYRRIVAPYENKKLWDNDDVYD